MPGTGTLVVLAAITRVAAAILLGDRFHFIDEAIYVDAARALLAGDGYGAGYANVPAQPVLLAALAAPWPESLLFLRCAHAVVTGVLGGLVVSAFGRRAFGPEAARIGVALWALDPLVVVAGGLLYADAIAAVVLTAAMLALVTATRDARERRAALAGALLGLTILFRPVAGTLVPVFALWIACAPGTAWQRSLRRTGLVLAACGVVVAPWVLTTLARDGRVVPAGMAGVHAAPVPDGDVERRGLAASLATAAWGAPIEMARHVARELAHFWELYPTRLNTANPTTRAWLHRTDDRLPSEQTFPSTLRDAVSAVTFGTELALALAGLVAAWRTHRAPLVLVTAVILFYGLGYALFVAKLRYRIAILPSLFLLTGVGAVALADRWRTHPPRGSAATAD